MNVVIRICLVYVLGILISCRQKPVEIYVAPNGDDKASGTKEQPVQTFEKANELAASFFGKKEVCIILIDQLYVNGERQRMARFPNAEEGKNVFDSWEPIHTREPDPDTDPLDPERVASWANPEGAYVHAMHNALWGDMHWLIKGKNSDGTLKMEGGWQNNRPSLMHPRYRMVENVFEELDVPGEWFFNQKEGVLYYLPLPGTAITSAKVEIVRLKYLVEFQSNVKNKFI